MDPDENVAPQGIQREVSPELVDRERTETHG